MEKQEKRVLTLDRYEHGVVVNALNESLKPQASRNQPTRSPRRKPEFAL